MPQLGNRGAHFYCVALVGTCLLGAGCGGGRAAAPPPAEPRPVRAQVAAPEVEVDSIPEIAPTAYVTVKSITDRSPGKVSKKRRASRASSMRNLIIEELRASPAVTMEADTATDLGLEQYNVDATIEKLARRVHGGFVEVVCELRLSISNGRGRMLSFLTGGIAVQVPRHSFRREYVPQLEKEALEGAAKKINRDLMAYLDRETRVAARVSRR